MGVEYPVLAFIAGLMFVIIVFSSLFLYLYILGELYRIPVVSGSGDIRVLFNSAVVQIKVIHERGEPVKLERISITTDMGIIICIFPESTCNTVDTLPVNTSLLGFVNGNVLLPGSMGLIIVNVTGAYPPFTGDKVYTAVLHFDKGILIASLAIVYEVR